MFSPMTPTTERVRIQNENAELNRYARRPAALHDTCRAATFRVRFSRPKAQDEVQPAPHHARVTTVSNFNR